MNLISSLTCGLQARQWRRRIIRTLLKALDRSLRCSDRLEASGGADYFLKCSVVSFKDVVEVFAGAVPGRGWQLAFSLQPTDRFWVRAKLVGGYR